MAFGAWSVDRFERERGVLGTAVAPRRPASLDPVRFQPLHLVGYERADTGFRSRRERAAAFWRDQVAPLGPHPFAAPRSARALTPHAAPVTPPPAPAPPRAGAQRARSRAPPA